PEDEAVLDRLADRLFQHEAWGRRLEQHRDEQRKLAPQGVGARHNERHHLGRERRLILERRPELAAWEPNARDCDQLADQFQARTRELERVRKACEAHEKHASAARQQAEREVQVVREGLTAARAVARSAVQELQRLGDETTLKEELTRTAEA